MQQAILNMSKDTFEVPKSVYPNVSIIRGSVIDSHKYCARQVMHLPELFHSVEVGIQFLGRLHTAYACLLLLNQMGCIHLCLQHPH